MKALRRHARAVRGNCMSTNRIVLASPCEWLSSGQMPGLTMSVIARFPGFTNWLRCRERRLLMSAIPPSSPSRRHFLGIAAAAGRKLSMITIGSSALSILGTRDAAAGFHEHERGGLERLGAPRYYLAGSGLGLSARKSAPTLTLSL